MRGQIAAGYHEKAVAFRDWSMRAAAGYPSQNRIMYGIARRAARKKMLGVSRATAYRYLNEASAA